MHDGRYRNWSPRSSSAGDQFELVGLGVFLYLRKRNSSSDVIVCDVVEPDGSERLLPILENAIKSDRPAHYVLRTFMFQQPDRLPGAEELGLNDGVTWAGFLLANQSCEPLGFAQADVGVQ